jgi:hypothetical protein
MKKALASVVLLASSAGVFALPAAAHDRDDHRVQDTRYYQRDHDRFDRRDRRDWRDYRYDYRGRR